MHMSRSPRLSVPLLLLASQVSISLTPPKSFGHVFGGGFQGPLEILIQPDLTAATALRFGPASPIPQHEAAEPPWLV